MLILPFRLITLHEAEPPATIASWPLRHADDYIAAAFHDAVY